MQFERIGGGCQNHNACHKYGTASGHYRKPVFSAERMRLQQGEQADERRQ